MKTLALILGISSSLCANNFITYHNDKQEFNKFGITIKNISAENGKYELWHSKIGPHACTPKHKHNTEEVVVFIDGEGKVTIGDEVIHYKAPCTITFPANIEHQIFNTTDYPTNHIVMLEKDSSIYDTDGKLMSLPWRR